MPNLNLHDVTEYVEENIGVFHQKRIAGLNELKLKRVLSKKNLIYLKRNTFLQLKT